jgi:hypothetical protein
MDPAFRDREAGLDQAFRRFAADYGAAFRRAVPPESSDNQRVLVVSSGSLGQLVEIALVTAFRLAGYRPVILTDYDRWMNAYYCEIGVQEHLYWDDCFRQVPMAEAVQLMASIGSFEQLIKADYCGARVGKYAASTVLRHLRVGRLDLSDRTVRDALLPFLHRAMCYARTAEESSKPSARNSCCPWIRGTARAENCSISVWPPASTRSRGMPRTETIS